MADSPVPTPSPSDDDVQHEAQRRSRRAFLVGGLAVLASYGGWRWLVTRPADEGTPWPLRRMLDANGQLYSEYFSKARLAPVFPRSSAHPPRFNGRLGLGGNFDPATWRLRVQDYAPTGAAAPLREFTLADIQALPKIEMTTELKCIEGWSVVSHWAGARFADFVERYFPAAQQAPYVSVATPDRKYYVGLDMQSALHPQTLLCYEVNGEPLPLKHGAPLRLVTPMKYGIKYLKRIGTITFPTQRPPDYWAQRGYDWYAGH